MKKAILIAPLLALGLAGSPALANDGAEQAQTQEEARIPFANTGGIRDWKFADRDTLYVQDRQRNWYEATLMGPATGARFEWVIGIDTGPLNTFDRFSSVVVDGQRYPLKSLVRIDGEPEIGDKADAAEA